MLLILGIVLVAFSIQKSNTEEKSLGNWNDIGPSDLLPQDTGPTWALEVPTGGFFEFNVSATGSVRVTIGTPTYDNVTDRFLGLLNPIFDQVGTRFTQKVVVDKDNTYEVQIKNEGTTAVTIGGNVSALEIVTMYQTIYPYSWLGPPLALVGSISLICGVFTSPSKRHYRKTRALVAHFYNGLLGVSRLGYTSETHSSM